MTYDIFNLLSSQEIIIPQYGVKFRSFIRIAYVRSSSRINAFCDLPLQFLIILFFSAIKTFFRVCGKESAWQFNVSVTSLLIFASSE